MIIERLPCPQRLRSDDSNETVDADRVLYFLTGIQNSKNPVKELAKFIAAHADTPEITPQKGARVQNLWSSLPCGPTLIRDLPEQLDLMLSSDRCHGGGTLMHNRRVHLVLSAARNDKLSAADWQSVIQDTLYALDLDHAGHSWLAIRHGDTEIDHVHLYAGTIDGETGKASKLHRDPGVLRRLCNELEERYTLQRTGTAKKQAREAKQQQSTELTEQVTALIPQVAACKSWQELHELMSAHNLQLEHRPKAGLVVSDQDGNEVRPGRISRSFSFSRLKERWGEPEPEPTPQPAVQQAQEQSAPRLIISAKFKNAALRDMLSRTVPGTVISGADAVQARAAREAAKLGITGLSFENERVQAAYSFMLESGTVLRTTAIENFEAAKETQETPGKAEKAAAEMRVLAPAAREPWAVHYLRSHGYAIAESDSKKEVQAEKGRHQLRVSSDGRKIGITDTSDEAAMRDALRALQAGRTNAVIRLKGSIEFQRKAAALAAGMQIEVVPADPQLAREFAEHPPKPITPPKILPTGRHRRLQPWYGAMRLDAQPVPGFSDEQKRQITAEAKWLAAAQQAEQQTTADPQRAAARQQTRPAAGIRQTAEERAARRQAIRGAIQQRRKELEAAARRQAEQASQRRPGQGQGQSHGGR